MGTLKDKYRGSKEFFQVYCKLIEAARLRGVITYQEIAEIMGLPLKGTHMGREVGYLLGEISDDENDYGRPLLSAVAVSVRGTPGPGFFGFAKSLGKLQGRSKQAKQSFWESETAKVYSEWAKKFK